MIRILVFCGIYWGSPYLGKLPSLEFRVKEMRYLRIRHLSNLKFSCLESLESRV